MKVLICDPISPEGIEFFKQQSALEVVVLEQRPTEEDLISMAQDVAAYVVRSETKNHSKGHGALPPTQGCGASRCRCR